MCYNLRTKFECTCNAGYFGNGTNCQDVNECRVKGGSHGHFCNENTQCVNLPGGYRCDCLPGFERKDSLRCVDVDECVTGQHKCGPNSRCVNTIGGHQCHCESGFRERNGQCVCKQLI